MKRFYNIEARYSLVSKFLKKVNGLFYLGNSFQSRMVMA